MRYWLAILLLAGSLLFLYVITNNKLYTVNLEQYVLRHQSDPLFAFEGTNPDVLQQSVKNLQKSLSLSINYLPEETRKITQRILFPITFLESIPKTENLRIQLLKQPSIKGAIQYHFSLLRTMYLYKKNAQDMIGVLSTLDNADLAFLNGYTNAEFYISQLHAAIRIVSNREEDERVRFKCLLGVSSLCNINTLKKSKEKILLENKERTPREILLRNREIIAQSVVRGFTAFSKTTETINELPIVRLNNGVCRYSTTLPAMMFWWGLSRVSNSEIIRITPVNDLLFYDLQETEGGYYQTLKESGLLYQHQPLNPYLCPDFGHDASLVLTSYYIQNDLMKKPIFSGLDKDLDISFITLSELEKDIVSPASFLNAGFVEDFIENIKSLLNTYSVNTLTSILGSEKVSRLYSLTTIWDAKSAWTEYLMGTIDDMGLTAINISRQQDIPTYAFFLTRSYISTLFFLSNETIVDVPLLLTQKKEFIPVKNFHLRSYNDDLILKIPPHEAPAFISDTRLKVNSIISPEFYLND